MNDADINLKIAELFGFEKISGTCCSFMDISDGAVSVRKDGKAHCLNFINDPVLREPLMIELLHGGWTLVRYAYYTDTRYAWVHSREGTQVKDNHFGIATCLAYLELKKE